MNDVVQPVTINPLLTQDNLRFSKLVVDIVQGRDTLYHVMYIGTGEQEGAELGLTLAKNKIVNFTADLKWKVIKLVIDNLMISK